MKLKKYSICKSFSNFSIIILVLELNVNSSKQECVFSDCALMCTNRIIHCSYNDSINFPKRTNVTYIGLISQLIIERHAKEIPNNTFNGLSIDKLFLLNRNLEKVNQHFFNGINSLKTLRILAKNLAKFEPDSILPIKISLLELELSDNFLSYEKFDVFVKELKKLKNLKTLKLFSNSLKILNPDWFVEFSNLNSLYLNNNDLNEFNLNLKNNTNLEILDISFNKLSNFDQIIKILQPIKNKIVSIYLSNNLIELINATLNFKSLETLDLSSNKIKFICENCLVYLNKLVLLNLTNNLLSNLPNTKSSLNLMQFDISNQNGNLKLISDFSFSKNISKYELSRLDVNLSYNDIQFGYKPFCPEPNKQNELRVNISMIGVSLNTFNSMNLCLFKQLKSSDKNKATVVWIKENSKKNNKDNNFCNCNSIKYLSYYNIKLIGLCESSSYDCNNVSFVDPCKSKTEFDCNIILNKKNKMETKHKVVNNKPTEKANVLDTSDLKTNSNLNDADDSNTDIFKTKFKYFSFKYVFICLTSAFITIFLLIKFIVSRFEKAKHRDSF